MKVFQSSAGEAIAAGQGDGELSILLALLSFHGIATDAGQFRHQLAGARLDEQEMLRLLKGLELKARIVQTSWPRLANTPLPAIAFQKAGGFLLIAKTDGEKALVQASGASKPKLMTKEDFEAEWDGRLLLVTTRAGLADLARRFDLSWFLGAILKYRRLLSDVLVASFFLQVFALISPLFFQVVIDKVLVHRTETTLDVLVIGLLFVALFEAIMGGLRTYLFAHTTNRIDVELGARLFRHLLALPLAYFQARRVGDSVARVRELENIRVFITSSALTLVIDLFFTFVFLGVMFLYSPNLTLIVILAFPFYIAISAVATPIFRRRLDEKFRRGAENQAFLVESVTGVETLKSMAVEPQMQRRWEEQLAAYVTASFKVLALGNVATESIRLIDKVVTGALLFFGAHYVMEGSLTVGELVAFNMLASRVSTACPAPCANLAGFSPDPHLGGPARRYPQHAARAAVFARTCGASFARGEIVFEHVTFRYRIDGPEILSDVSFSIPAGQIVGIVGPSGSGKSTLAKLIQRLYVPESGRVLVDGTDLGACRHNLAQASNGHRPAREHSLQPDRPGQYRAGPPRRAHGGGNCRGRTCRARTTSSSSFRRATTP